MAASTAAMRSGWLNGFARKSTAPALIARTDEGMSPCPVIKTIGGGGVAKLSLEIQPTDVRQFHVQDEAGWQISFPNTNYSATEPNVSDATPSEVK